jgi:CRISPR-associated endonuclease Csy4
MTTHYVDITLLPDPEFSQAHLMGALVAKLHRVLAQGKSTTVGTSYPQHIQQPKTKRTLGAVLRLHGTLVDLERLMGQDWLKGMRDHTNVGSIQPVPLDAQYRTVRRRQFKTSAERLRRRRMRRKGETAQQAAAAIPDSVERAPDLPFVHLHSSSTGQAFCLYIEHGPLQPQPVAGHFNTYGLADKATVPWF